MQLKYVNPESLIHDIQVPSIQVEPLRYGQVYDVDDALGALLATTLFWEAEQQMLTADSDLRRVSGIGEKMATALAAKGIRSLTLLAEMDAVTIDAMMDGSLDYVTVEIIRGWQDHARQLMEERHAA